MGPETEIPNYSAYHNGEMIGDFSKGMELPELSIPETVKRTTDVYIKPDMKPFEINCKFISPKYWKCRSRKRFVKILMKHGYDRNSANRLADTVKAARGKMSYRGVMFLFITLLMLGGDIR